MRQKKFKWTFTVNITVDESWVADGFNPDSALMSEFIRDAILPHAYSCEKKVTAVCTRRPDQKIVSKVQGFRNITEMRSKN